MLFSEGTFMHVRRALALALVVPLLLAGCSDDPEPTPQIPDPTSSSPTPSPTATESETPEAETAEDFIRRWAAVEAEMENTGETAEYLELSERCKACRDLADTIEGFYEAGGSVTWGGWTIRRISAEPGSRGNAYSVEVSSAPTQYRESAGGPLKRLKGGESTHVLRLVDAGGSWTVVDKAELAR